MKININNKEILHDVNASFNREWLLPDGLGGWASASLSGATTRSYHGLLVAALHGPVERTVMLTKLEEDLVTPDGTIYPLGSNEWAGPDAHGQVYAPEGFLAQTAFSFDGASVTMLFSPLPSILLEKRLFCAPGANTLYVVYTLMSSPFPLNLLVRPFLNYRNYHAETSPGLSPLGISPLPPAAKAAGIAVAPAIGEPPAFYLCGLSPAASWISSGSGEQATWYRDLYHRAEAARGLAHLNDVFVPGHFMITLAPNETLTLVATATPLADFNSDAPAVLAGNIARLADLIRPAVHNEQLEKLFVAADQFIVSRSSPSAQSSSLPLTVIAGYHWFGDWGRDTMIALPGLTLVTGKFAEAASILRTFASYADRGMIPNRFPDHGEQPEYNTADAILWFFHACERYFDYTNDLAFVRELFPVLAEMVDWHEKGTRYQIRVDPADHLLHAGEPGVQLTWMDAKIGDWVVTPRYGKPVEINALWYNALGVMCRFATLLGHDPAHYQGEMDQVATSFRARFWRPTVGYLYDVVDSPTATGYFDDPALRPNQLIALSLPRTPLLPPMFEPIVAACTRALLTPFGLRTLAPDDPAYKGVFVGDQLHRDAAYHQGTVWPWLIGPFCQAHFLVYQDREAILRFLQPLLSHLDNEGCIGSINEVFGGDPPHQAAGCVAQAWSVAEVLRVYREIIQPVP